MRLLVHQLADGIYGASVACWGLLVVTHASSDVKEEGVSHLEDGAPDLDRSVKIFTGLNDASGSWNTSYHHEPDSEIVALAGESQGRQVYRIASVYREKVRDVLLGRAVYHVDSGVTIKYAFCQLHGAGDCIGGPPPPTENMILEWDNSTTFNSQAKYKCLRGYFMDTLATITEQTIECRGQLGGWVTPEIELYNCTLVEVCDLASLPCAASPLMELELSSDFLTLDSFIEYSCPYGMEMPGSLTSMNVSCIEDESTAPVTYRFSETAVSDCNICTQEVNITHATTTWVNSNIYTVGLNVDIQCLDGYLMKTGNKMAHSNATIECTYIGWFPFLWTIECVPVIQDTNELLKDFTPVSIQDTNELLNDFTPVSNLRYK
ncbi:uncharacterized protein [Palaemon carinicauda]|uniref:uncharacterized protein n=1 Tax=Palaemon carinicauda TaxID=392227 RepID=UPI0035B63F7A